MPHVERTGVLSGLRNLLLTSNRLQRSQERLASGLQINRASDNPAGFVSSEILRSQIAGVAQAEQNVAAGINFLNTAGSAAQNVTANLQRLRELAVVAANDTLDQTARDAVVTEDGGILQAIDQTAASARFGGTQLLEGATARLQIGEGASDTQTVTLPDIGSDQLGLDQVDLSDAQNAAGSLSVIDNAIQKVLSDNATLGSQAAQLASTRDSLSAAQLELSRAESNIRDTDFAREISQSVLERLRQQIGILALARGLAGEQAFTGGLVNALA